MLFLAALLSTAYVARALIIPYFAEQSSDYYIDKNFASSAIDRYLMTSAVSGRSPNSWLKVYFNLGTSVGKVVIEKGWNTNAMCDYQMFINFWGQKMKSPCSEKFKFPRGFFYNSYANTTVDCGGQRGNSVLLEQSGCDMYIEVFSIKVYDVGASSAPALNLDRNKEFLLQFMDAKYNDNSIQWSGWYRDSGYSVCNMPRYDSVPRFDGECLEGGTHEYEGTMSTAKGFMCQRWDSPNRHVFGGQSQVVLPNNYCRNPGHRSGGAWCYLATTGHRWAYCDIPPCLRNKVLYYNGERWMATYSSYKDSLKCGDGGAFYANSKTNNLNWTNFYFYNKLEALDDTCEVEEDLPKSPPQPPPTDFTPPGPDFSYPQPPLPFVFPPRTANIQPRNVEPLPELYNQHAKSLPEHPANSNQLQSAPINSNQLNNQHAKSLPERPANSNQLQSAPINSNQLNNQHAKSLPEHPANFTRLNNQQADNHNFFLNNRRRPFQHPPRPPYRPHDRPAHSHSRRRWGM